MAPLLEAEQSLRAGRVILGEEEVASVSLDQANANGAYGSALCEYLRTRSEAALYQASLLSEQLLDQRLGPEEIVALHAGALEPALAGLGYREQARASGDALYFLLEVMIRYGVQYQAHMELRLNEGTRQAETTAVLAMQRAEDAEQAAGEKTDILAVVAHELRTPMTSLQGHLQLAHRALSQGRLESLAHNLTAIETAAARLRRLMEELTEASRNTASTLERQPLELGVQLVQACELSSSAALEKRIALGYESATSPQWVLSNASAMLTIFSNLLSNAIRYTPAGGSVTVRAGGDAEHAWVVIQDTGIGMALETRRRIFEKFYRAPEAQEIEAKGLGLGLALVQQLVSASDGTIEVVSTPGEGSTFRVVFPVTGVPGMREEA